MNLTPNDIDTLRLEADKAQAFGDGFVRLRAEHLRFLLTEYTDSELEEYCAELEQENEKLKEELSESKHEITAFEIFLDDDKEAAPPPTSRFLFVDGEDD